MAKITILGAGGFGVSLAIAAYQNQHQVTVWDISEEIVQAILRDGEHKTKLPGVKIPKGIGFTTDPHCMENSDMVVFVVPSLFIRSVAQRVKPFLTKDTILVNASKGVGRGDVPHHEPDHPVGIPGKCRGCYHRTVPCGRGGTWRADHGSGCVQKRGGGGADPGGFLQPHPAHLHQRRPGGM